jgi:hypothetical protein
MELPGDASVEREFENFLGAPRRHVTARVTA